MNSNMPFRLLPALLVTLAGCAGSLPALRSATPPAAVRVMTYNIFAGNDLQRQSNLTRVAALIDSLNADVVFLQEVDRLTSRSGRVDQAAVLAELTGLSAVFGRSMDFQGGEYGNAILSRFPIISVRTVPLLLRRPEGLEQGGQEPRSLLHAIIAAPGGDIHLLNTHLDHQADPIYRHAQLLQLLAYVAGAVPAGAMLVLGGDMNARPDSPELRALGIAYQDVWTECGAGGGFTFRSDRPDRRIDYLFTAGARCTAAFVLDTLLSDHRPLVADLQRGQR